VPRPFNSQNRMHFRPVSSGKSAIFAFNPIVRKENRIGGIMGQEMYEETRQKAEKTGSVLGKKRKTQPRVQVTSEVFGNPNVLVQ